MAYHLLVKLEFQQGATDNMRLPNFKRLMKQDYAEQFQDFVETLSSSLNYGIEVLYSALNNNLTLKDNLACTIAEFNVTVGATGAPTATTSFTLSNNLRVEGIVVLAVTNNVNAATYPPSAVFINFTSQSDSVIINNITGLTSGISYKIKVVAFN